MYLVICAVVFGLQRWLLFFPTHNATTGQLKPWKEAGQIIGFCHEAPNPRTVWLMMHGNAGQAADRDYVLDHLSADVSLYVLEYPGYGSRSGQPSQAAFDEAALSAYNLLALQYPDTPLGIIGESIGSGPASTLASAPRRPDKITLIVPFDSLPRVASRKFFFLPVWLLLRDRWDNIEALRTYAGPVDIFGAGDDKVIPCEHARNLAKHLTQARFFEIRGGHNDWASFETVKIER